MNEYSLAKVQLFYKPTLTILHRKTHCPASQTTEKRLPDTEKPRYEMLISTFPNVKIFHIMAGFLQQRFMWVSGRKKLKNTKYKPWGCIL